MEIPDPVPLQYHNQFVIIVNTSAEQLGLVSSFSIFYLHFPFIYGFFTAKPFAMTRSSEDDFAKNAKKFEIYKEKHKYENALQMGSFI